MKHLEPIRSESDYDRALVEVEELWGAKAGTPKGDRGQVDLVQHEYENAVEDEARAIQLDPKLASGYYLRSVAFGDSGDREKAVTDLHTAIGLDPSLATYVTIKDKTVVLRLPPL